MNRTNILFFVTITLSLLASVYIIVTSNPIQPTLQPTLQHKQAQTFLTDVIGLDLTKYTLTLLPTKEIPQVQTEYDENNQEYQVESASNQFKAYIEYENNKLTRSRLRWIEEPTQ
ncbi:MAG: hypothetical protein AC479_08175, partial [miscellaneous Crenarchaeota group-6 archaeon AD8-1]